PFCVAPRMGRALAKPIIFSREKLMGFASLYPSCALPGDDHAPVGDAKRLFDEIEEFFTGVTGPQREDYRGRTRPPTLGCSIVASAARRARESCRRKCPRRNSWHCLSLSRSRGTRAHSRPAG